MIVLFVLYWIATLGLFIYGMNAYVLVFSFVRKRDNEVERIKRTRAEYWARVKPEDLPTVTVQLPLYNERYVAGRLIHAVAKLEYPRDKLDVQVLDDSTDDTASIVAEMVEHFRKEGLRIDHIRRDNREGYKAGALKEGLETSTADLVAIFDADFVPEPDWLTKTVPYFEDEEIGLVQARWGHVNEEYSPLTRAQGVAIDGHFAIEQAGRRWGGFFLNFNGTAGIWRRKAIDDAGGWNADTLTEDLDLSYRSQLAGYRIEYCIDVEVPAEIPPDIPAFKSQQRRWAKGSIQTAMKLLPQVLRNPTISPFRKYQAVVHLTAYMVHPFMFTIAILAVPLVGVWESIRAPLSVFALMGIFLTCAAVGPSFLYVNAQRALRKDWIRRSFWLPVLMIVGTGIAVSNTRAILEAFMGIKSGFVRTPKRAMSGSQGVSSTSSYKLPFDLTFLLEAVMCAYSVFGLVLYALQGKVLIVPFLGLYAMGFGTMAYGTLKDGLRRARERRRRRAEPGIVDPVRESEEAYGEVLAYYHTNVAPKLSRVGAS